MEKLNIVFMGTPAFAAKILRKVHSWAAGAGAEVVGVYAQPDKPAGRGHKMSAPVVKVLAQELDLPVFQPANFRNAEAGLAARQQLADLKPDVLVVAAYGLILPQAVLDIPTLGPYNVHASLLPKYRGAAPVQRAIMNGDKITGISIMRMEAGLDTGPVLLQQASFVEPDDTSASLLDALADQGGDLMRSALGMIAEKRALCVAQNEEKATQAPKLRPEEGFLAWLQSAECIHNTLRGVTPWPGGQAELVLPDKVVSLRLEPGFVLSAEQESLVSAQFLAQGNSPHKPGQVLGIFTLPGREQACVVVACGTGLYGLEGLRPAGKATQSAKDIWNGTLRHYSPGQAFFSLEARAGK